MPSNAVVLAPLVAGFIFLRFFSITRYVAQGWDGTRLVLWTALTGVVLFLFSRLLILHPLLRFDFGRQLSSEILEIFPGEYVGSLAGALLLGLVLPFILNIFITPERAVRWTRHQGDLLHALLTDEVGSGRPIAFTLNDNKVYIGLVLSRPTLHPKEKFFKILPTLSGFRDKRRMLHITTNYADLLEALERGDEVLADYQRKDLQVILPLEAVCSARLFDARILKELFESNKTQA